ncbi:lipopolysaccharide biosynthesis protein [Bradyrhizobium sp. DASA03076]|uniref:lipopolysaccharide biosynthesis protein n=1 Tax=Bradyrhizobium sp. BLXBL-03 TaxID=3395916 RepID=UPI003F72EDF4
MQREIDFLVDENRHEVGGRLVNSAAVLWATTAFSRAAQLISTAILARMLTPDDYGIIALATAAVGFINILSDFQVSGAIIKSQSLTRAHLDTAFTISLIRGLITGILLVLSSGLVAHLLGDERLKDVLCIMAIPSLLACLNNPLLSVYSKRLDFARESRRQIVSIVIGAAAGITAAFMLRNYWAIVLGSIASSTSMLFLSYYNIPWRPRLDLSKTKEIVSFGVWLILIGALDYLNGRVDYLLIGRRFGSETLGAYHIGQQITVMTTGDCVAPLSRALFPAFSLMSSDVERLRKAYREAQSVILAMALPIGFGMSAVARDAVYLFVGPQWEISVNVVVCIAPLIALQTMLAGIETVALSMDRGRDLFVRAAVFFIFRVSVLVAGFHLGGLMGIVIGRVITGSFFILYGLHLAARITHSRMLDPITASWRSITSVTIMYATLMLLPNSHFGYVGPLALTAILAGKIVLGASIYVISHSLLWIACGAPAGAERRMIDQLGKLRRLRFRTSERCLEV